MSEQIDEALLVAYVDGELDTEATRVVEAMLDTNAGARQYVSELRESAALLRGAFHDKPTMPIPNRLVEIINGAVTTPQALRRLVPPRWIWAERRRRRMPTALAASLAALAIGVSSGYLFSELRVQKAVERIQAGRVEDRKVIEAAVTEALEKHLSGASTEWSSPGSGMHGAVTPTRTFRDAAGQWCREYEEVISYGGDVEHRRGIACRTGEGEWKTRLRIEGES
jgi:surface antigen